ncbi:hypothetical protein AB1Y20_002167 [Prymnesium parvum]|uniref:Uncharacterized protein n=1 Tax=Prymnesium parvum TaxID=97485 RepID=A0AB34J8D0_PRYPA
MESIWQTRGGVGAAATQLSARFGHDRRKVAEEYQVLLATEETLRSDCTKKGQAKYTQWRMQHAWKVRNWKAYGRIKTPARAKMMHTKADQRVFLYNVLQQREKLAAANYRPSVPEWDEVSSDESGDDEP